MSIDLAYAAAFLDCDGTISLIQTDRPPTKSGKMRYEFSVKMNFYSQNEEVLHYLESLFGGNMQPPAKSSTVFSLQLSNQGARKCLTSLLPYLRIKRDQAALAIKFQSVVDSRKASRWNPLTEEDIRARASMVAQMQFLNHRDSIKANAHRSNRVNSVKPSSMEEAIPSRAVEDFGSTEGVTARPTSSNSNSAQERPTSLI